MEIRGHFDGASRGNPGPAGAGAVLYKDGELIWQKALPLGLHTNNEAEYMALGILLGELNRRGIRGAVICGDSKLVISQMSGQWKIKEARLSQLAVPLLETAAHLSASFRWVPREQNAQADQMSNWALDRGPFEKDHDAEKPETEVEQKRANDGERFVFHKVSSSGWVVEDHGQEFLIDCAHENCSCPEFRKNGYCLHLDSLREKLPLSGKASAANSVTANCDAKGR